MGRSRTVSRLIPFICSSSAAREVADPIWPIVSSAALLFAIFDTLPQNFRFLFCAQQKGANYYQMNAASSSLLYEMRSRGWNRYQIVATFLQKLPFRLFSTCPSHPKEFSTD